MKNGLKTMGGIKVAGGASILWYILAVATPPLLQEKNCGIIGERKLKLENGLYSTQTKIIGFLKICTKMEHPLLITIDGKPIHDCETVFVVRTPPHLIIDELKVLSTVFDLYKDKGYLFFSNKKAAEDYFNGYSKQFEVSRNP